MTSRHGPPRGTELLRAIDEIYACVNGEADSEELPGKLIPVLRADNVTVGDTAPGPRPAACACGCALMLQNATRNGPFRMVFVSSDCRLTRSFA